jgi:hypothetical protein
MLFPLDVPARAAREIVVPSLIIQVNRIASLLPILDRL